MPLHNTIEVQRGQRVNAQPFPERRPLFWVLGSGADDQALAQTASWNSGSAQDPTRVVWVHDPSAVRGLFRGLPDPARLRGFTTTFNGTVSRVFGREGLVPDDVEVVAAFAAAMAGRVGGNR